MRASKEKIFTGQNRFRAIGGIAGAVTDEDAVEMVCYITTMKLALFLVTSTGSTWIHEFKPYSCALGYGLLRACFE